MTTAYKIETLPKPFELIKKDTVTESELNRITSDIYSLLGWNRLPESIQDCVRNDILSFSGELFFQFTSITEETKERKKRIHYWIGQFKAGHCTEKTVVEMLTN